MAAEPLPPRVLLVMSDQWPRALLRAALREVGYDASGTRVLSMVRGRIAPEAGRGPVRLVVLDQNALTEADAPELEALSSAGIPIVLLAPAVRRLHGGPWTQVIRRPFSIGDLVQAIERLVPLAPEARRPVD
jgi:hypothetical protein